MELSSDDRKKESVDFQLCQQQQKHLSIFFFLFYSLARDKELFPTPLSIITLFFFIDKPFNTFTCALPFKPKHMQKRMHKMLKDVIEMNEIR